MLKSIMQTKITLGCGLYVRINNMAQKKTIQELIWEKTQISVFYEKH